MYLRNISNDLTWITSREKFIELRTETFKKDFPASALITVIDFARPGILVDIQGIAVVAE